MEAQGQNVQIDTFKLKKNERFREIHSDQMNYPIIRTRNTKIDSLINFDLKNRFTYNEYRTEAIDSTLIKWAGNQIIYLDFNVTYNRNGILSLNISAEGCGANCTGWTDYYNYSTVSGKLLDIAEIIDTTGAFKSTVYRDKESQYLKHKLELKKMLEDPQLELDQSTYEWVLAYYQDCETSFTLESFAIYPDHLEIIAFCYLPNAIKNLTPLITLKYNNAAIKDYLLIKH